MVNSPLIRPYFLGGGGLGIAVFFWGSHDSVDGSEIRRTSWYGKYPNIYMVSYMSGGFFGISSINSFIISLFLLKKPVCYLEGSPKTLSTNIPEKPSIISFCQQKRVGKSGNKDICQMSGNKTHRLWPVA